MSHIFSNMDISLVVNITGMKIATHVAETHWEERVSQDFDIVFVLSNAEN